MDLKTPGPDETADTSMFSQYTLGVPSGGPHRGVKASHKKSRYGCKRCRTRRVKVSFAIQLSPSINQYVNWSQVLSLSHAA